MFLITLYVGLLLTTIAYSNPIDASATKETKQLFTKLLHLTRDTNHLMFGQQKATQVGAEGGHSPYNLGGKSHDNGVQGWMFTRSQADHNQPDELCDVKRLTGQYPAVLGFDLGHIRDDDLAIAGYLIKKAADRGSIITVSWHMYNPITNGRSWISEDPHGNWTHSIKRILPGGDYNKVYKQNLDIVANWMNNLYGSNGRLVPVLFRIFHEMDGNWFWWGTSHKVGNTVDEFKQLWIYTVEYLRDTKHVHNVLYSFSPSKGNADTQRSYLQFYPGDNYVDLFGLDFYFTSPFNPPLSSFQNAVETLVQTAKSKLKPAALTETGLNNNGINSHQKFWTDHVLNVLKHGHNTLKLAYVFAWSNFCHNDGTCSIWVPYKGHPGAIFFMDFYNDPKTVFQTNLTSFNHNIFG